MVRWRAAGDGGAKRPGMGPRLLRGALLLVVVGGVLILLFTQVFPRVERLLDEPTLGSAAILP